VVVEASITAALVVAALLLVHPADAAEPPPSSDPVTAVTSVLDASLSPWGVTP
jgi:hypothetical protein